MRLIDADRLSENIYDNIPAPYEDSREAKEECLCAIEEAPTIDAVPVVRCKDCKYYKISELHPPYKFCFRLRHPTENRSVGYNFADDDFCSHGECREDKDG